MATGAFWGRSLYFHLVALIALALVLGGTTGILVSIVEAVVPECYPPASAALVPAGTEPQVVAECYPPPADAWRTVLNAGIFVLVGAPIMWWHLRQGRRTIAA